MPQPQMKDLRAIAEPLLDIATLNAQHWDESRQMYLDWGRHTEKVALERSVVQHPQTGQAMLGPMKRVAKGKPKLGFVPQFGCVSMCGCGWGIKVAAYSALQAIQYTQLPLLLTGTLCILT